MGTSGLVEIKRRIQSIQSTKKITKAMGFVATSKLKKVKNRLTDNNEYVKVIEEIVQELVNSLPDDYESIYINRIKGKKLYIVITSDAGLCGGFNNNVVSYFREVIEDKEESEIILIGKKGISYFDKFKLKSNKHIIDMPDVPTNKEVNELYNIINEAYRNGEITEVNIVCTIFKSPINQVPKVIKLLPIEKKDNQQDKYIIEPNIDSVFNNAMNLYIKSKLMECLLQSRVSEESARKMAMDGATDNATEMLRTLNIKFNRIRQSIITQEISEIVGGAEAQK
ncbi:ATP synthase F1 subunit gamma [Clostridium disporicum]|uniref:ATP synthase gamma chain n=1 Tax=Clostridium disporicum TaxID=84024 RepID=A0A174FUX7_9CLOT|nr:ATP synthase F1 subunit gamma [Clostridium disporicum]CUO51905.1 F0F1 ATP synthase subunit gamma [Clostridium disporicum]